IVSIPRDHKAEERTVRFQCNGLELAGDLYLPAGHRQGDAVLFLHGSTPLGRKHPLYPAICKALQARGFTVLNLDQRGHGESEKPAAIRTAADLDFVADAREAARAMLSGKVAGRVKNLIIAGHSFGGGVALVAGLREDCVGRVVSISPGRRINERILAAGREDTLAYVQKRKAEDMGLTEPIPLDLIRGMLEGFNIEQVAGCVVAKPLLIIEGTREDSEDLAFTSNFVASLTGPVQHSVIPKADHYFGVQGIVVGEDKRLALVKTNFVGSIADLIDSWARGPQGGPRQ
ncbi:MAG: alpha/beta fold hydrolase, partial [bacterium]